MPFNDRLKLIISNSNLTASAFADKINIQPSSISHVLSGRNKPSLEFIQKIISNFDNVNYDWLIDGKGEFNNVKSTLFDNIEPTIIKDNTPKTEIPKEEPQIETKKDTDSNKVVKIVFFHQDGSFKEYSN
ncbi:MAG: helix-turn-helix transcriptional regulator [Flavobacteriaceae bacterium]|nr:helix-turn-helix transcriptional regulator [Flavobacteriaceae bacterium]